MVKPAEPQGLDRDGATLWRDVVSKYELRVDELRVLESACRAADRVTKMRALLDESPLLTVGSTGQTVVHPLVAEIRAHEAQLAAPVGKLKLPDEQGAAPTESRSTQARAAAQSRWAAAHGASA